MLSRNFALALFSVSLAGPSIAQERNAYFDAPVVVADYTTRFQKLGDINGDGFMDAFSAWWTTDDHYQVTIAAFINDGQGNLVKTWHQTAYAYPLGTAELVFAVGDVNGDGLCDLAFGGGTQVNIILTGPGGTQGVASQTYTVSGAPVTGLALVDLDGDGIMELAVMHSDLTILHFDANGSHALTPVANLALNAVNGELQPADVDGSGHQGFMAWDATRVMLIPMNGTQPQAPTTFLHGCGSPKAAAGDIDGDGDQDVVVFDMGTYVILRRTSPTTFVKEGPFNGGPARYLFDFNGDGFLDGVCCGDGNPGPAHNDSPSVFRIALNDGTGHFAPAIEFPGLGSERLAGAADLDHDGDLDLVAGRCVYYGCSHLVDGIPRKISFAARENAFCDFDGDKDLDLEPGLSTQRNLGDGTFATFTPVLPSPPPGKTWVGPGYPGDFDGDGNVDLIVQQKVGGVFEQMELLKNNGGGSFVDAGPAGQPGVDFTWGSTTVPRARDCIAADVDGDGDIDLILPSGYPYTKIYLNDGNGHFTPGPSWPSTFLVRRVADMNGDGVPDLIGYNNIAFSGWYLGILVGLGNGNFDSIYYLPSGSQNAGNDVFDIGDADGDGDLDIVSSDSLNLNVNVNNTQPGGALNFQTQLVLPNAFQGLGSSAQGALFTDFDCDGKLDIVAWPVSPYGYDAPNASYVLHRNDANNGYDLPSYQVMQPTGHLDLDGDGDDDLIGANIYKNRHFESTSGGMRKQFAGGIPGGGGVVPTLGAKGPFRVGQSAEIVLTGAMGGISGVFSQHYLGDPPPPFTGGMHQGHAYIYYPTTQFTTSGTYGEIGTGKWSLPFTVPAYVAGRTKVYSADLHDPLTGLARTNKLHITYGP